MAAEGFKIAFGVMSLYSETTLEDQDFVSWEVSLDVWKNLQMVERVPLRYHKCT
jgi:hypothetical protein